MELAKGARRDGQGFESAMRLHRARELPTDEFKREVEKELTGKEEEPSEIIYFKLYKSQIPVIEQATDTAALMLGSDKSRGYCPERQHGVRQDPGVAHHRNVHGSPLQEKMKCPTKSDTFSS